ncbi:hypothetical protein TRIP_B250046 [uncultured Desulfatiglans sp.]|nr:hypothetical protein TRIP_B250046 [uncultured Desulfatiglans sp.]
MREKRQTVTLLKRVAYPAKCMKSFVNLNHRNDIDKLEDRGVRKKHLAKWILSARIVATRHAARVNRAARKISIDE